MKGLQLAGGWKKFAIPAEIYGHLEITGVHSQMRELSGGVKNPVKSVLGDGLRNCSEKKKGPQVCTARPKSREETPRKGMQDISAPRRRIWQCGMIESRGCP